MSLFSQFPAIFSCNRNMSFDLFGLEANWGCIASILGGIVILILILACLSFLSRHDGKHEELQGVTEIATSSPQFQQLLKDDIKITDSGSLLPLLLNLQQQQQVLKVGIDRVLTNIAGLEQSLSTIEESTQNLDRVITGAQSKGALGEQIVGRNLSQLPQEWVRRNVEFRNDTRVEFCVCSPDGRLIPIDSKWAGTRLLDQLGQTGDKTEKDRLIREIKQEVYTRALEVGKYLDDYRTIGFGIATVPDAVFDLCLDLQPYLIRSNIVLVSYSLLVPYILILVKLFLSTAQATQAMQISHVLSRSLIQIEQIQRFIDTKVRTPLDTVKLQQTQYNSYNQQLQAASTQLSHIQSVLTELRSSLPTGINTMLHTDVDSIPKTLQHSLNQLRQSLFEDAKKQDGHSSNDTNQSLLG